MSKRGAYLGGHSIEGSTAGFAGWGARKAQKKGPGLVDLAPEFDPTIQGRLIPREKVSKKLLEAAEKRKAKRQRQAAKRAQRRADAQGA